MPSLNDFPDVAVRIVHLQLTWVRVAGLLSVVIAALVATGVFATVMRLVSAARSNPREVRADTTPRKSVSSKTR